MSINTINLNSSIDNKNTVFHSKLFETSDFHLICVTDNTYIAFTSLTQEWTNTFVFILRCMVL